MPTARAPSITPDEPPAGRRVEGRPRTETLALQARMHEQLQAAAPHADALVASVEGRRRATRLITTNFEHIPAELLAHQLLGVARCDAAPLIEYAMREGYRLEPEKITCPVRIVWGTNDKLLPWPSAAARFRDDWLPNADWVELDDIGHCPQLDIPLETSQLIIGFTAAHGRQPERESLGRSA
jgi:pimeloyl-ACP methyl ester carboxylesterase